MPACLTTVAIGFVEPSTSGSKDFVLTVGSDPDFVQEIPLCYVLKSLACSVGSWVMRRSFVPSIVPKHPQVEATALLSEPATHGANQ